MRINVAVPENYVAPPVLNSGLEAVTRLNEAMIRGGDLEPFDPESPQARWKPEPPGDEHFDHGRMVQGRGWGDCDDLAPWRAASLRVTGEDRGAEAIVKKSGPKRWHAVVRRSDGSIDDPSLDAGMPGPGRKVGVVGAVQPTMHKQSSVVGGTYIETPRLAMRPVYDRTSGAVEAWQARTDLPWHTEHPMTPTDIAMASLHASPVSDQALVGALEGAIALGEANGQDGEHLDRLRCISDMVQGAAWEECAEEYGPHHADAASHAVGKLFKRFRRRLKKLARGAGRAARGLTRDVVLPLAPTIARAIPGVGPMASMALQSATPALQKALRSGRHLSPAARFAQRMAPLAVSMQPGMTPLQRMAALQQVRQMGHQAAPTAATPQVPTEAFAAWI